MPAWADISKAPMFGTLPPEFAKLPLVSDRLRASLFFTQESAEHAKALDDPAKWRTGGFRWLTWAALVAISSAREAAELDLAPYGLEQAWTSSPELAAIKSDPLLWVAHELRNFAVHFDLPASKLKPFRAVIDGQEHDFGNAPHFEPIDWNDFSKLRNVARADPIIAKDMVDWFNEQAKEWPAIHLIGVTRERFVDYTVPFIRREIN